MKKNGKGNKWLFFLGITCIIGLLWGCSETPYSPIDVSEQLTKRGVITPDSIMLTYQKGGNGDQCMLIPNGNYMVLALGEMLLKKGYTVVFYDPRNRGISQTVRGGASKLIDGILNDVKDIEVIQKHLGIEKVTLIAHGYMAWAAQMYALEHPERVEKLVSISIESKSFNGNPKPYIDEYSPEIEQAIRAFDSELGFNISKSFCQIYWSAVAQKHVTNPKNAIDLGAILCQLSNEAPSLYSGHLHGYILPSFNKVPYQKADWEQLQTPILLMHAVKDRVNSFELAEEWHAILPNSTLVRFSRGGHFVWVEENEKFQKELLAFLNE